MTLVLESFKNATVAGTGGGTLSIDKPTGLAEGDLMIVLLYAQHQTAAAPAQSGWDSVILKSTASGDYSYIHVLSRIATSGDAAASSFSFAQPASYEDASGSFAGALCRISGFDPTDPVGASGSGETISASPSYTGTSITPLADSLLLFGIQAQDVVSGSNYAIATDNPTWTERVDGTMDGPTGPADGRYILASASRAEATATGNASASLSASTRSIAVLVAINPAPPPVAISGVVTLQGAYVEGATVRCIRQSDNVALPAQTTDSTGEYVFSDLDVAELYHLAVEYEVGGERYNALSLWDIVPVEVV